MVNKTKHFGARMTDKFIKEFQKAQQANGYATNSEWLREKMREEIEKARAKGAHYER